MTEDSGQSEKIADARSHRKALAAAFRFWAGQDNLTPEGEKDTRIPEGRHSLSWAGLAEGEGAGTLLRVDARDQPWALDLEREAGRLLACESGGTLLRDPSTGRWRPTLLGCGARICPVCAAARAGRARTEWQPVYEAAAADGAEIRHWTVTQRADCTPGGLVTAHEARRYGWQGMVAEGPDTVGWPTGGESLGEAYCRLREGLRRARTGKPGKRLRRRLGGYIRGTEWTGRGPGGIPRWHVHCHMLSCVPRDHALTDAEVDHELQRWARLAGGSIRAQHCRIVGPDRVAEVLKYPFKPANLTSAQRIETLAYARGLRPHHTCGAWHSQSNEHDEAPWSRWLAARPVRVPWRRLHWWHPERREYIPWTGTPDAGIHTFAVLQDASAGAQPMLLGKPVESAWTRWEADAEDYVRILRGVDTSIAPSLEPGSDEEEGEDGDSV